MPIAVTPLHNASICTNSKVTYYTSNYASHEAALRPLIMGCRVEMVLLLPCVSALARNAANFVLRVDAENHAFVAVAGWNGLLAAIR